MNLRLEVDASSVLRAFAKAPEATRRHLRIAVQVAAEEVKDQAQKVHRFQSREGRAERAVSTRFQEPMTGSVFLDPAYPVASMIHQGTKAHAIFPKNRKRLRWATGGGFAFAKGVWHPGTKPDPFLYDALRAKEERIQALMTNAVQTALREATA